MSWIDLLALVPLITMASFLWGLHRSFKPESYLWLFIGLSVLTGIIRSFISSLPFHICFYIALVGIIAGSVHHWITRKDKHP
jgi:hypothetical protein